MNRMLTVVGTPTESGTYPGFLYQQFQLAPSTSCASVLTVNSLPKPQDDEESLRDASGRSVRINYRLHTYGGVTCIVILHVAEASEEAPRCSRRNYFDTAYSTGRKHTLAFGKESRTRFGEPQHYVPASLANDLVKLRNRMVHLTAKPGLAKMEDAVESTMFLSILSRLARMKKDRIAARHVYSRFYELRMEQDYPLCDRILGDVDVDRLAPVVLIALLTITAPLKKHLDNRTSFYERAKKAVEKLRGPDATQQLFIGLE